MAIHFELCLNQEVLRCLDKGLLTDWFSRQMPRELLHPAYSNEEIDFATDTILEVCHDGGSSSPVATKAKQNVLLLRKILSFGEPNVISLSPPTTRWHRKTYTSGFVLKSEDAVAYNTLLTTGKALEQNNEARFPFAIGYDGLRYVSFDQG